MKLKIENLRKGVRQAAGWVGSTCREAITPSEIGKHLVIMGGIEASGWMVDHGWRLLEAAWRLLN